MIYFVKGLINSQTTYSAGARNAILKPCNMPTFANSAPLIFRFRRKQNTTIIGDYPSFTINLLLIGRFLEILTKFNN